jgi:uncharacterized OB-fold protein
MTTSVRSLRIRLITGISTIAFVVVVTGCGPGTTTQPGWTFGPTLAPPSPGASASAVASAVPAASASSAASVPPTASPAAVASISATPTPDATPKPFSGRMTPQVLLQDGYVSMYLDLENTGNEPLTFLNTLYDIEPDKLYSPVVVFPWTSGENAVYTRAGRFFPSPAIVQPGDRAVYMMGGMEARGTGVLADPVANIKFCPTRGMDDLPSLPVSVDDVHWSSSGGVTTVTGTLVQPDGSQRVDPPIVGVAFFDEADAFVGAVVDSRAGTRLVPGQPTPFTMTGRGVNAEHIVRAEAYAFVS